MSEKSKIKPLDILVGAGFLCSMVALGTITLNKFLTHELMTWRHDRIQAIAAESPINKTVIEAYDSCWHASLFPPRDGCITDAVLAGHAAGATDAELTGIFKRFPIVGEPDFCHENSYGCNPMWIGAQDPGKNTILFNEMIAWKYPDKATDSSPGTKTEAVAPVQ